MSNFAILRFEKIKSANQGHAHMQHNRRAVECPTAAKNINNKILLVSEESRGYREKNFRQILKEKTKGQKVRKNAVMAIETVMTFSPNAVKSEDLKEWTAASINWLGSEFGGRQNIVDAVLHLDEQTPHIHAFVIPIDENGKLNARKFLGGTKDRLSQLQTSYAKDMERFGLDRGICKAITKAQHQASKRFHAEQAEKEVRLHTYEKVFGKEKEWEFDQFQSFIKARKEIENELLNSENSRQERHKEISETERS